MKYYGLKISKITAPEVYLPPEVEKFSVEGDLYDLFKYLARGLEYPAQFYFMAGFSKEPIVKFEKFVFVKGLRTDVKETMFKYLDKAYFYLDSLLVEEPLEEDIKYYEKFYPCLLEIRNYLAEIEFFGSSSYGRHRKFISLYGIRNGKILVKCTVSGLLRGEFDEFKIGIKGHKKMFPIKIIRGIYTPEELAKVLILRTIYKRTRKER